VRIKGRGKLWSCLGGAATALAIVACTAAGTSSSASNGTSQSNGCNQNCDLNGMPTNYPDYYRLYMNVDGQPSIGFGCYHGVAIVTTSRDQSAAAAQLAPSQNAFCQTQMGSKFSRTGQASDEQ